VPTRKLRRTITSQELRSARRAIERFLQKHAHRWGAEGWGFVGEPSRLALSIHVRRTLASPSEPIEDVPLPGGGALKPTISGTFHKSTPTFHFADAIGTANGFVTQPLAPGTPIIVDSTPRQAGGIACIVRADGAPYLITCGHIFEPRAEGVSVFARGEVVATLEKNLLDATPATDGAWCRLTRDGKQMLAKSADAPTWFRDWRRPSEGDHGSTASFWPTVSSDDVFTSAVLSSSFCQNDLWNRFWSLKLDGLIQVGPISSPGDSGALLSMANTYYGLCTGQVGAFSYFTPLCAVIEHMKSEFDEVTPWQFDDA
jgi:hypothetical protein